ncbi:lipocalin family protein [Ruegeria sp. ANG10]|uniref:lipocalin family protein n=1 Tax=Ruegeria sp. ANG10 TaxID=3042467 RepID=UPI0034572EEB
MIRSGLFALMFLALAVPASAKVYRDRSVAMTTVQDLEVERYLGLWYEIARFPNRFEKGCVGVTAEYGLLEDGQISVTNTCREETLNGQVRQAEGKARIEGPGQLSVTFVPWLPFARGDYWVLGLRADYSVAVVGAPRGSTGWILARTPEISAADRNWAESVLQKNGYDTGQLTYIPQVEIAE